MPPVDGTYAPRSPDLSTLSSSANQSNQTSNQANTNTNASSYTGAYQAPRSNSTAQNQPPHPLEREEGYTPRSPKIPRYDFTSTEPPAQNSTDTRRTSVYQPPISPQYQQGYRRHSTYQPPILDLPPAHTNSTWGPPTHTSTSYTSPIYARNSSTSVASQPHHQPLSYPPRGTFSQAQRSGYSIPQSALTYQSPAYSQPHSQPHLHSPVEVKRELVDINLLTHAKSVSSAPQSVISPTGTNSAHPFSSLKLEDSTTSVKEEDRDSKMADIKMDMNGEEGLDAGLGASKGIEVKTKFPVARIKRIMQADEEVGKVAQVTPVVVSKALELFMISLVTKSADLARAGNSKRVTAIHLKKTIEGDEQFDFLNDIVAKVADQPDAGQEKGKGRKKEESESGEDEKPKKKGRRKKGE